MKHTRRLNTRWRFVAAALACGLWGGVAQGAGFDGPWVDTREVGPFVIQGAFPLGDYEPFFLELPALERELVRTLGVPPARQPIYVCLFADAPEHRAYVEAHHPQVPYRRALFIKTAGRNVVYAYRQSELEVDLRHECTHALLHASLADVPLWLDEGLAEYFEVPEQQRAFDHPHFDRLRWSMRLGMIRSIATLEQLQELSEMDGVDYRFAWAWAHFMLHGPVEAHQALVDFLADARQRTATPGLSQRLERAVPGATDRMVQHFKYWHR